MIKQTRRKFLEYSPKPFVKYKFNEKKSYDRRALKKRANSFHLYCDVTRVLTKKTVNDWLVDLY